MESNWMTQLMPKFEGGKSLNGHAVLNEWLEWKLSFEAWAEAMEIHSQAKKFKWLLVAGGRDIQRIYSSTPKSEEEIDELKAPLLEIPQYNNAVYRLESYFQSKSNPRLERQILSEMRQQADESVNAFVVRIRAQAIRCGFDEQRVDEEVFFQIMQGAKSEKVKQYAATKTGRSVDQLISYAINDEIKQQQQRKELGDNREAGEFQTKEGNIQEQVISALKKWSKPMSKFNENSNKNLQKCYRCGSAKHYSGSKCPAIDVTCHNCNKTGHFARVCLKKRRGFNDKSLVHGQSKKQTVNQIMADEWDIEVPKLPKKKNDAEINANVGGVNLLCLIDSGSPINTVTEQDFIVLLERNANLYNLKYDVKDKFSGYGSKTALACIAKFIALVRVAKEKPQSYEEFFVIKDASQSLLSRLTSEKLHILKTGLTVNSLEVVEEFPKIPNIKIKLIIDETIVPKQKTFNCIPRAQEKKVVEILEKLEREGIIEKVDGYSKWISPLIVVPKGLNDIRCCVDMREPNLAIKRVIYPIPTLDFILCKLKNCGIFSKIDIKSAYHHVELHEDSRYVTAFMTHKGVMQFKRLTFGLCSAPEIFQKIMSQLIAGIEGTFCYMDDIVIAGETEEEHDNRLRQVMKVLKDNNLTLNSQKCEFKLSQIDFLGLTITKNKVRPSQAKIDAVKNFSRPETVEEVRSFLGLVNYLGKFIPNLSKTSEPLTSIVRNKVMIWGKEQQASFDNLKESLCRTVLELGIFDPNDETIVFTDASPTSLGSALVQRNGETYRVIEFAAKTLTATERKYPQAQREALAAVWAVEKFYYFLSGIKFTLCTDYRALQFIFKGAFRINKRAVSRAESWALRLQHYNFNIKYIPGKDNIADPLSRLYRGNDKPFLEESQLFICNIGEWQDVVSLDQISKETEMDEELIQIIQALNSGEWHNVKPKYRAMKREMTVIDGIVYKDSQIVIPEALKSKVLEYAHKGHPGEVAMKRLLRERVWWSGMSLDVHKTIKKCLGCALVSRPNPPLPLSRSKIPEEAWKEIAIDFFKAGELGELLVVVDYYSRYAVTRRMNGTDADKTIKSLHDIFRVFGNPLTIKSDNGPPFSGVKFTEYCKSQAIELVRIPPHQPQCNGLVERFNKNLKRILQIASGMKEKLASSLEEFVEIYNKRPCSVTNLSPFEMMFKRKARNLLPLGIIDNYWTESEARERDAVEKLKGKIYADKRRMAQESDIKVGDFVMIKDILSGHKLKCRFVDKKYQVIDRKFAVLTLKDEQGVVCKRHVDHAKIWPNCERKEVVEKETEDINEGSQRKKRRVQRPARYQDEA